jgi:hypothetical protein
VSDPSFRQALEIDDSLALFDSNRLLVFAMGLYLQADDIAELGSSCLTDGKDDKGLDFFWLDLEQRRVVLAQGYEARDWAKASAPSNKAVALMQAISWLLQVPLDEVPLRIRPAAQELRDAISDGEIDRIDLVYAHNLPSSQNVHSELRAAAHSLSNMLPHVNVGIEELGAGEIETLYTSRDRDILIEDKLLVPCSGHIDIANTDFTVVNCIVSGEWLFDLYEQHREKLFSANVREYLGSRADKRNINNQIKQTAASEPSRFLIYNNGITLITNKIEIAGESVTIFGVSIVNGAQTTGALHESNREAASMIQVQLRIVQSERPEIVRSVIKYNNTQNSVKAFDRKSNDSVQVRLQSEFDKLGISYVHRRKAAFNPKGSLTTEALAQQLASFHGALSLATRNKGDIFESDANYRRYFNDGTSVGHIFLVSCFSRAVDSYKAELKDKRANHTAQSAEISILQVLSYSAGKSFALALVGFTAESLVAKPIPDLMTWRAKDVYIKASGSQLEEVALDCLRLLMPIAIMQVEEKDSYDIVRSRDLMLGLGNKVRGILVGVRPTMVNSKLDALASLTTIG